MKKIVLMGLLLMTLSYSPALCESLRIVTDYYPPFSYEKNGEIKGISSQIVKAVLKEAGMEATISQYPFKRAYTMTRRGKNIFEYCVVRTPEREPLFQWIGIVGPAVQVLFTSENKNIQIRKPEDLRNYKIGTVLEDVVDQYLSSRKDELDLQLDRISDYKLNMKKLMKGRFDLWGGNKLVGIHLAKELGYKETDIKEVYTFSELTDHYYLVTGLETSGEIVQKLRNAFETIHNNGTYQKIIDEYFE
ncbi:amino acid ABC transporter substrate-binding pro tein [Desulfonema ishimotonii]|uniref:Amino acid ABC transporter substrate-binding pro tein n=1 Tax=Desulfonema ishimotonii TaxID=45657 RepID=A0A401FZM2_9BACT|nr:transporter substrate-binding domain-containing protein [Desulfonema ishimotonii]GBC62429.1 amino acid ABC transporter substrate-binding pro tein [Desulfonema ishimotonii]